jgi:hypothetical protein
MDVGLVLLRSLMPELPLSPGTVLGARILSREAIMLAGVRLPATLPAGLEPGARISVRVQEATPERLLLQVVERAVATPAEAASAANAAPALIQAGPLLGLPGGAHAQVFVDPDEEAEDGEGGTARARTITLRYESAGVGRIDLALSVDPGGVRAVVHGPAGDVAERLRAGSGELRSALMGALGRPVSVDVIARTEVIDVDA